MSYTLLTGSTGLIGNYLLRDFAKAKRPVAVLVRGHNSRERLQSIIVTMEECSQMAGTPVHIPMPKCIAADLVEDDMGISSRDCEWMAKNIDDVVHCAGDITFQGANDGLETWRTNVEGTRNLATWSRDHNVEDFSYVSTSFVCGNRTGQILEDDVSIPASFGSIYEESKCEAEQLLRDMEFTRLRLLRPCAVSGDSETGYSSTFHGIYWFAQFCSLARMRLGIPVGERWFHDVRIFKSGTERHHLIPVDLVSKAIIELHSMKINGTSTFHLTPPQSCTLQELETALSHYFNYYGVSFASGDCCSKDTLNDVERIFYEGMESLGHRYLDGDPSFDCSNTIAKLPWWTDVRISQEYLRRIFDFADRSRYGRGRAARARSKASVALGKVNG